MKTLSPRFTGLKAHAGWALVVSASVVLHFMYNTPLAPMVPLWLLVVPIGLELRGFDRSGIKSDASMDMTTTRRLAGSPEALVSIGFGIRVGAWYFGSKDFAVTGITILALTTVVAIYFAHRNLQFPGRRPIDVVWDFLYGASGWSAVAVAGVVGMFVASGVDGADGVADVAGVVVAGVTGLACLMSLLLPWQLALTERARLRTAMRRASARR